MKLTDFRTARDLAEARAVLKELGPVGLPMAGGTSLVFTSEKDERVAVDINRAVPAGIARENGSYRIGPTTRCAVHQATRATATAINSSGNRACGESCGPGR